MEATMNDELPGTGAKVRLYVGRVEERAATLERDYFQAVVCDPPYGLSFMGKAWDYEVPNAELWGEVLRTLVPGAPLIAFSSSRTYHRAAVEIEDAGFEVIDQLYWLYGQGWPKGLDVSKAVDAALGAERRITGHVPEGSFGKWEEHATGQKGRARSGLRKDEPATEEAARFKGWNTQLKPACEPAVLAMRPPVGTFAQNALAHGVAGFNVEASRIGESGGVRGVGFSSSELATREVYGKMWKVTALEFAGGRYPSNVVLSEESGKVVDLQGGCGPMGDEGPSQFYYCPKPSKFDRGAGNAHPTVKPVDLIRYFAKLVQCPSASRILVPFSGSGSEVIGCLLAGWKEVVGIEMDPTHAAMAKKRIEKGFKGRVDVEFVNP
jgi:DNA modification methylase